MGSPCGLCRLWRAEHHERTCHVIRGNAHATSRCVMVGEWVRRGTTAKYVGSWPRWRWCVALLVIEELHWNVPTCSRSLLKYMRPFIPIPYEKLCEQKRTNNSHSFVIISPWVWWKRRKRWRKGLVAMLFVMSQIWPVADGDWTPYCMELVSHPSRSGCRRRDHWTGMRWTTFALAPSVARPNVVLGTYGFSWRRRWYVSITEVTRVFVIVVIIFQFLLEPQNYMESKHSTTRIKKVIDTVVTR
jgi:hypothetical protein